MKKDESLYTTRDRFEIYVLLSTGCILASYASDERGVFYFSFKEKSRCTEILAQLLSKQLKIHAHDMINAIRDVQAIFNNR